MPVRLAVELLLNRKDVYRREIGFGGFLRIDVGERGVRGAEIDTDVHAAAARSRTLNSSFQRRPSAATHQSSSMPVSVTLLSSVTGTTSSLVSSLCARQQHFDGSEFFKFVASIVEQVPGASSLRASEEKKRNSAGSPTTRANRRCGSSTFEPSSSPNGTTVKRLHGRRHAGNRGQRTFDANVVGARNAAANANSFAAAREPVICCSLRDRVHQIASFCLVAQFDDGRCASILEPAIEHFKDALLDRRCLQVRRH